ncbi:MAG: amidohydrolase family protein [Deltaproteobacteria bacterium]|nr:amidohydrolase family protein [Deltaproteobacteria bacterium]
MQIYEGAIVTCDAVGSLKQFLVEDKGKIVFVGDELPNDYIKLPRVKLQDQALLPAFADTHIHYMSHALFDNGLDVRTAASIADVQSAIKQFAKSSKQGIITAFGASPHSVAEKRLITKSEIDAVCSTRGVFMVKYDGHACIINSHLLAKLPNKIKNQRGFNADTGIMTQEAFFRVTDFITAKVPLGKTLNDMLCTIDTMAAHGIGLIHSVAGVGFPLDMDVRLESLFARGLRNPLSYRLYFQTMDIKKVLKRKLPRVGGCFATALDGSFGSLDAALIDPYSNDNNNRGVLFYSDQVVHDFARTANRAGLQIEMHAIGDHAFEQGVDALAAALEDFPRQDHRHTIIHACLPTERGLERCAKLDIGIALQPAFIYWHVEPPEYLDSILGSRLRKLMPLKTMCEMGIKLAGGSDAPCTIPDPLFGIWSSCNHPRAQESLSIQQALNLYTRNAAWMSFDDDRRGSLEVGKIADMIILDLNPLAIEPQKLKEIKVKQLLLAGKPYKPGQSRANLIWRGLFSRRSI